MRGFDDPRAIEKEPDAAGLAERTSFEQIPDFRRGTVAIVGKAFDDDRYFVWSESLECHQFESHFVIALAGAFLDRPLDGIAINGGFARFLTDIKDLDAVSKALKAAGWNIVSAEIRFLAKTFPSLDENSRKDVTDFLNALDDHEDVHRVYAAVK